MVVETLTAIMIMCANKQPCIKETIHHIEDCRGYVRQRLKENNDEENLKLMTTYEGLKYVDGVCLTNFLTRDKI